MIDTAINAVGKVELKLYDHNNCIIDQRSVNNIVTNDGKLTMLRLYSNTSGAVPLYLGIGTGTSTPSVSDTNITQLGSLTNRVSVGTKALVAYNNVDVAVNSYGTNVNQIIWKGTFAAGNGTNAAVTEAGIFTAATGGLLFARCTFAAINKNSGSRLDIYWGLTIS